MANKVILVGNLGKEPELKDVNGSKLAMFTVATNETYKRKDGEKVTETEWHNCQAWGKTAEVVGSYLNKGDKVYCEGKIRTRSY